MLFGKTIVITRSEAQSDSLVSIIAQQGGRSILLPMLRIEYSTEPLTITQPIDVMICLSANVVTKLQELSADSRANLPRVIAIGAATAQALSSIGMVVHDIPSQETSEGILDLASLHNVNLQHIAICCGENPRPLLTHVLQQRGATVTEIYCYRRQQLLYPQEHLAQVLESADYIICSSQEGLQSLVSQLTPQLMTILRQRQLIVVSVRIANYAKQYDLKPIISLGAGEQAILQSLKVNV